MRLLVILLLIATLARAQSTSSPRKFFAYSLSNSRGPNLIRGYSFFYNETLSELPGFPIETGGVGDGLGQFGVERVASVASLPFLYATNDVSQTISVFAVNRQSGALTLLPDLTTTVVRRNEARYDDFAVTLSLDGRFLFVGAGSSFIPNRVLSYRVDPVTGALSLISSLMVPVISLPLRISQLAVAPGGNLLAVSLTSVAGYVALYGIEPLTGVLQELDLMPDQAPFGRPQGLAWSNSGSSIYSALVNNNPASVGAIGISVVGNRTLGLEWTLRSGASDDSNLIAVDPTTDSRLFFSTQMPALVVATRPETPPSYDVIITPEAFEPPLLSVEYGSTVTFTASAEALSVVQVSSDISCLPKALGVNSNGPLGENGTFAFTFDLPGTYWLADSARCALGLRMQVDVGSATDWQDPSILVNPARRRATTLDVTFDGEHVISSLQTGGLSVYRLEVNSSLTEVAFAEYNAQGLQGTTSLFNMPECCKLDDSGPIFEFEEQLLVPCNFAISGPVIKLLAACEWLPEQVVTKGVQLRTCSAQCDALFHVTMTDLCGQSSTAVQYIRHEPDTEAPVIDGGLVQASECTLGVDPSGDAARLQLSDQCQPIDSLFVSQALGPLRYRSPLECRTDKVTSTRQVNWTVTDSCNNSATSVGQIDTIDTLAPEIEIADSYMVPCTLNDQCGDIAENGGVNPDWSGWAKATDQCWGALDVSFIDDFPQDGNFTFGCDAFNRTWMAMDFCGNVGTRNQLISFEQGQEPVFMVPVNVTLECGADSGFDRTGGGLSMIQAPTCVNLEKNLTTFRIPGGVCTKQSVRTYSARKTTCGFWERSAEQYVTEVDTLGPMIVLDPLVHVSCGEGGNAGPENPAVGFPRVVDLCQGEIPTTELRYTDNVETLVHRPPHCLDLITRTWSVADVCGNTANATQLIYATRHCFPCGSGPDCPIVASGAARAIHAF